MYTDCPVGAEALDSLLCLFQMTFGQVYVPLRDSQVRVPHQLRYAKHVDACFDGACALGMAKVVKPKGWFDCAGLQGSLVRWLKLCHGPAPVIPITDPARKEIFAFCFR